MYVEPMNESDMAATLRHLDELERNNRKNEQFIKEKLDEIPDYVKQAVNDCLKKGKRNHSYTSFRSTKGKTTGADAVQIGGNWFFGH